MTEAACALNPYGHADHYRRLRAGLEDYCKDFFPAGLSTERLADLGADANAAADNEVLSPWYADALEAHAATVKKCPSITKRHRIRNTLADWIEHGVELGELPAAPYQNYADRLHAARLWGHWGIDAAGEMLLAWAGAAGLVKLCPDDAREEGQRILEQYGTPLLLAANVDRKQLRFAVFTTPNVPADELAAGMRDIWERFNKRILCYRRKKRPFAIVGALVTLEAPLAADGTWNIHLNAILIFTGRPDYKALRAAWGFNVELKQLGAQYHGWQPTEQSIASAIAEVVKYPLKHVGDKPAVELAGGGWESAPGLTQWPYARFLEWYEAHRGHRRTRASGCLYDVESPPPLDRRRGATMLGRIGYTDAGEAWPSLPILYRPAQPALDLIQRNKSAENRAVFGLDAVDKCGRSTDDPPAWADS